VTYAGGLFEIFSSRSNGTMVRDLHLTHNVVFYVLTIQQTVISSHGVSNLINSVNFLKCYSFMANLALDTGPFLENLKSHSVASIFKSMQARAWCVPSPPPTTTDAKSKTPSAIDVGMSSKHPKLDSDSNGGSDGGRVGPMGRKHKKKDCGGASRGVEDRSDNSDACWDAKGKGRAHAGMALSWERKIGDLGI
jgi:hypothetical protein